MEKSKKIMYDAWIDDILDDVRNNVVGEYWHVYFDEPFLRKSLKHLLQQSKLDYEHKYPSNGPVLHFKYENDYEVETPSKTLNYLMNNLVVDNSTSNDLHTVYYFILKHIGKTQGEDNILSESYSDPKLDKIINHFFKRIEFDDDKELLSIKDYTHNRGINTFLEYSTFCTYDTLETYISGKIQWVLDHVYGLNKREVLEAGYRINNLIRKRLKNCELKGRYNFDNYMTDKEYKKSIDYNTRLDESLSSEVNDIVDKVFNSNPNLTKDDVKSIFKTKYDMNSQDADEAEVIYLSKQQSLNESTDKQGRFLDRVIEQLVKETIFYPSEGMISLPRYPDEKWNARKMFDEEDYFYNRLVTHTVNHCRDVYGLTNEEINYVWQNYLYEIKTNYYHLKGLNESDERSKEERNWYDTLVDEIIDDKLLKDNGQSYNKINRNDPITHKELNYLRNPYQRKIIKHLLSVSRIKPGIIGGTRLYFDDGTGYKPFSTTSMITDYVKNTFDEDKIAYDLVFTYLRLIRIILDGENQSILNEENKKGMDTNFLFKVADSIIKNDIEVDESTYAMGKSRAYGTFSEFSSNSYVFWVNLVEHAMEVFGVTHSEGIIVANLIWDNLNSKNVYQVSVLKLPFNRGGKIRDTITEQDYSTNEWEDERSRERNINLLKSKGITVLSTDSNVPFYKRIDSKEIRFLNKVADRLDKESKIEEVREGLDDEDFILITPFGEFEYVEIINEYRHRRFEEFVKDIYGVDDKQIMFPVHNSIAQTRESQFLWEMYKDKLRRKYIQLVNPGWDIPDDAIIIEQDLTDDDHKSLLKSFEYMDTPEEIATEELGNLITWVKDLPEELYLYRVLYLDDENQINYDELGSHYSQDRTDLINNHYDRGSIYGDMGEHAYLITVKVPKSEVDVMETLNNNILYPHEKEITLKDKGRGAQYLDVEKI